MGSAQASAQDPAGVTAPAARAPLIDVESLVRTHSGDVFRIIARLLGPTTPRADIEDLTQQVFIAAHGARHRFRGDAKPSTWLYGIASRTVLRYLRGWRRNQRMLNALEAMTRFDAPSVASPEQQVGDRELLATVWSCLLRIKPKKRIVYVLHEIEGLSVKQIAEALEVKEATVWSRLRHARQELDRALEVREVR